MFVYIVFFFLFLCFAIHISTVQGTGQRNLYRDLIWFGLLRNRGSIHGFSLLESVQIGCWAQQTSSSAGIEGSFFGRRMAAVSVADHTLSSSVQVRN